MSLYVAMQTYMYILASIFIFFFCSIEGCRCPDEWTGETCEERVDIDCQGVDCGHGHCADNNADGTCKVFNCEDIYLIYMVILK